MRILPGKGRICRSMSDSIWQQAWAAKAYQIGAFSGLDLDEYRRNANKHGMRCARSRVREKWG